MTDNTLPPVEPAPLTPPPAAVRPDPYAPPVPPPAPPAYAYQPPAATPPQGLSIASMITGIAGIVFLFLLAGFGLLPGIAAIIMGHIAQRRQPYARGFWLTGLITGYVSVAIAAILAVIAIVFLIAASAGLSSLD